MKNKKYLGYKKITVLMKLGTVELIYISSITIKAANKEAIKWADIAAKEGASEYFNVIWGRSLKVGDYKVVKKEEELSERLEHINEERVALGWSDNWRDSIMLNSEGYYIERDEDGYIKVKRIEDMPALREDHILVMSLLSFNDTSTDE